MTNSPRWAGTVVKSTKPVAPTDLRPCRPRVAGLPLRRIVLVGVPWAASAQGWLRPTGRFRGRAARVRRGPRRGRRRGSGARAGCCRRPAAARPDKLAATAQPRRCAALSPDFRFAKRWKMAAGGQFDRDLGRSLAARRRARAKIPASDQISFALRRITKMAEGLRRPSRRHPFISFGLAPAAGGGGPVRAPTPGYLDGHGGDITRMSSVDLSRRRPAGPLARQMLRRVDRYLGAGFPTGALRYLRAQKAEQRLRRHDFADAMARVARGYFVFSKDREALEAAPSAWPPAMGNSFWPIGPLAWRPGASAITKRHPAISAILDGRPRCRRRTARRAPIGRRGRI